MGARPRPGGLLRNATYQAPSLAHDVSFFALVAAPQRVLVPPQLAAAAPPPDTQTEAAPAPRHFVYTLLHAPMPIIGQLGVFTPALVQPPPPVTNGAEVLYGSDRANADVTALAVVKNWKRFFILNSLY